MKQNLQIISVLVFILLYIRGVLGGYDVQTLYLTLIINALLLFLLVVTGFSSKVALIMLLGVAAILHNKDTLALVDLIIFAYIIRKEDLTKYINWGLFIAIATTIVLFFLLSSGVIQSEELHYNHKGKVIANTMGMINPNMAGQFFYITFLFLYLKVARTKYKSRLLIAILIAVSSYFVFQYTQGRGVFISTLLLSLMMGLDPLIRKFKTLNKVGLSLIPIAMATLSFYLSSHLSDFYSINELTTDRVSNVAFIMAGMGIVDWLFGVGISDIGVDSSYMTILLQGGIIVFVLLFFFIFKHIWKKYEIIVELEPFIVTILAYGCMENIFSSFNCIAVIFYTFIFYPRPFKQIDKRDIHYAENGLIK